MNQVLDVALAFPTVILTILVGIAVVYWLFVILGALDVDVLGGGDADAGDLGGDIGDGGADVGDAGDAGDAGDGDADGGAGGGIWAALGLGKVPLTISVSLIVFFAWIVCMVIMLNLGDIGVPRLLVGMVAFVISLVVAVPPAALVARPLAPVFVVASAKKRADYIGSVCTITTGHVDARFGQARLVDGGDDLLIDVRCDKEDTKLERHSRALIIDYDDAREAYLVEAMDSVMGNKAGS